MQCPKQGGQIEVAKSICEEEELYVMLGRLVWPKATTEIATFTACSSESGRIHNNADTSRREERLRLTLKRGSTRHLSGTFFVNHFTTSCISWHLQHASHSSYRFQTCGTTMCQAHFGLLRSLRVVAAAPTTGRRRCEAQLGHFAFRAD